MFFDALKARDDKIAADKKKAQEEADKAAEKQRAADEAARIATIPQSAPVYQAPAPTSNCTTYHSTGALENIIMYESGGNTCATNPGGCFGLLQACPGAPLRDACGGDAQCQLAWFIANKTGGRSWEQVWAHELAYGYW